MNDHHPPTSNIQPPDPNRLPLFAPQRSTPAPATPHNGHRLRPSPFGPSASGEMSGDVDWSLVAALRAQASEQLSQAVAADGVRLDKESQEELAKAIVLDLIEATMAEDMNIGAPTWGAAKQRAVFKAVLDSLFRLGRLQPLVERDDVENILVTGCNEVFLELIDGTLLQGPPVADSDEELIDFLIFLASRGEDSSRPFSPANPTLHLSLGEFARLAAVAWRMPRPSMVIRMHRMVEVNLDDLVEMQMLTPVAASFLRAAVRARESIVVSGVQGAGKTTLVRALCAEISPREVLGTFETEYELYLHKLKKQHPIVYPWEARPGSGEYGPDGRQAGEFTLDEALYDSFRFNLSRQIVGEVRGKEVWPMIKAMESGPGSISTTHASDAVSALRKLVTCAMEAGPHVTHTLATAKLAATLRLVVHLDLHTTQVAEGEWQRTRRVAEIVAVEPGEHELGYATTPVFTTDPATRTAVPTTLPDRYRALSVHGFDYTGYLAAQAPYRPDGVS